MDQNTRDILETVNFIKDNMVTKRQLPDLVRPVVRDIIREELEPIHQRLSAIERELRDIRGRLDFLEEAIGSMKGYAKEIDDLRGRVREIEKHLGIVEKMAA
jgi:predicted  nucleic acid-binding Zn-ribbon protein